MITPLSRTKKWIEEIRGGLDSGLAEKMILAFTLVEALYESGFEFIFKGGNSLPLVTGKLNRFSIDIDIVTRPGQDIELFF
jgi:predicted nucleotidyltransferase component of viral defense system